MKAIPLQFQTHTSPPEHWQQWVQWISTSSVLIHTESDGYIGISCLYSRLMSTNINVRMHYRKYRTLCVLCCKYRVNFGLLWDTQQKQRIREKKRNLLWNEWTFFCSSTAFFLRFSIFGLNSYQKTKWTRHSSQ